MATLQSDLDVELVGLAPSRAVAPAPHELSPVGVGDLVYVRHQRDVQAAVIVETQGTEASAADPGSTAVQIRVLYTGRTQVVTDSAKLGRLWSPRPGAGLRVIAVDSTDHFRRLARTEVRPGDSVCEIGCSHGHTTTVLRAALYAASHGRSRLLATDSSARAVRSTVTHLAVEAERIRARAPGRYDLYQRTAVVQADPIAELCSSAAVHIEPGKRNESRRDGRARRRRGRSWSPPLRLTQGSGLPQRRGSWPPHNTTPAAGLAAIGVFGADKYFIDVGVDRPLPALFALIDWLILRRPRPSLVVVKHKQLLDAAFVRGGRCIWGQLDREAAPQLSGATPMATRRAIPDSAPIWVDDREPPAQLREFCQPCWMSVLRRAGLSADQVTAGLLPYIGFARGAKLRRVAAQRLCRVACVLERLYDMGNIAAVLRSAEAFGVGMVHLVGVAADGRIKIAKRRSVGAEKWLQVKYFPDTLSSVLALRAAGYHVSAAHCPADDADRTPTGVSLRQLTFDEIDDIDWGRKVAVLFGNEIDGVSSEALAVVDSCVYIGTTGFTQSLNVSVAAAVIFRAAAATASKMARGSSDCGEYLGELCARTLVAKGWTAADIISTIRNSSHD